LCSGGPYSSESIFSRGTEEVEDFVELVDVILSLEDWLSTEKFGQNTSY
jgi:hypothetical protein